MLSLRGHGSGRSSRELKQYRVPQALPDRRQRRLDFNIGRLMEISKAGGYYDNTIFVFFGDHNTRISQIPHMAPRLNS
ncbi:hypothetical protein PEQA60_39790 [Pseudomonas sp. Eqa60]|nr:hypothetical protein PEQA60_39790 [Pseudomonas sp. Eqa60]